MANYFDNYTLDNLYDEMEYVYLNDNRPWILGYSGGKDSSATLQATFKMLERLPKEKRHKPVYAVSYTHLTLPTIQHWCRSRWSPYH